MKFVLVACSLQTAFAARVDTRQDSLASAEDDTDYEAAVWKALIKNTKSCVTETYLKKKDGSRGGVITCRLSYSEYRWTVDGGQWTVDEGSAYGTLKVNRLFKFPAGKFDIDEQVEIPANTRIEGNANPNGASDKRKKPDPSTQTFFIATTGVSDKHAAYCGTKNNLKQGDAQKLRIGFLLNSDTAVKNINYQGKDTVRPYDNGSLCGGAVFETPGCVSPGFGDGTGEQWLEGGAKKATGCYDHAGGANDLITGNGKGVQNVVIDNVRLNDLFLPIDVDKAGLIEARASQIAVWVAQTQDGSSTNNVRIKNLVTMVLRGDGINFHGSVQDSSVEDSHIESTGDDIYAVWGGYTKDASGIVFRNNVGRKAGVTRDYGYGVCIAVYGAMDVEFTGNTCYDVGDWNPGQYPKGNSACQNGPYCNSCMAYIHGNWFGAIFPEGNTIKFNNNKYLYEDGTPIPESERPQIYNDLGAGDNTIADTQVLTCEYGKGCK